jgi:transposase
MLSAGELFSAKIWQSMTSEIINGFIGLLNEFAGKKATIIIDNSSVHKANATKHLMNLMEKQGATYYCLASYSSELNRNEKL